MNIQLIVLITYLLLTLFIGVLVRKKAKKSSLEFFLAGRNVSKLLLFFTMSATNFSAFTIFGFSGAGYRIGYAFYPVMGFGTGFMALSFYVIGIKIYSLSKERNYITPSDFINDRYNSPLLKKLFSSVMIIFTLPYLSIQAIASGKSLNSLIGIPYIIGAILITAFIIIYVTLGGLRSIVWTDLIQGIMMISFTLIAFIIISNKGGGFINVHQNIQKDFPLMFSRPGKDKSMVYGVWFGYMILWFFSDPMFPQLFQRFMVAKDEKSLKSTIILYPLITTFLFFLTVSIGVMGRYSFPNLPINQSDNIYPLLLKKYTNSFLSTILLTGSIAALMSTMDSQLLTLTSMITNDFIKIKKREVLKEKVTIIILGVSALIISIKPPETILDFINKTTFNGLAVLAPTVIGGLYWKRANRYGALSSIVIGEFLVTMFYFKIINLPQFLPIIPIIIATALVFGIVSLLTESENENTLIVFRLKKTNIKWMLIFFIVFILGNDFWSWGRRPFIIGGLPLWIYYYFTLGILLAILYKIFLKSKN